MNFDRQRLMTRRARLNMTQEQLAQKAGVSLRSVTLWEGGSGEPTLRMLHRISEALDVPVGWLLGENVPPTQTIAEPAREYGSDRAQAPPWIRDLVERLSAMEPSMRDRAVRQFHLTLDLLMSAGSERRGRYQSAAHDAADDPTIGIDPEVAETLRAGVMTAHRIAAARAAGRDEEPRSDRPEPRPKSGPAISRQSGPAKPAPMKTS